MVNASEDRNRHFLLENVTRTEAYRAPGQSREGPNIPKRDRVQHSAMLLQQIEELRLGTEAIREIQLAAGAEDDLGIKVEFESFPDVELAFEKLAREKSGIDLLNVRMEGDLTRATVFVPEGKLNHFEKLINHYLEEKKDRIGRARDNRPLIDTIKQIRAATLNALWTDEESLPTNKDDEFWWEAWIRIPDRRAWHSEVTGFRERAEAHGMRIAHGEVLFPERAVLLVHSSVEQMERSILFLNHVAELRRAKETADFFDSFSVSEQREWLDDLLTRTLVRNDSKDVPYVCLLDTGVNRGHPLLRLALAADDVHTVDQVWGTDDAHGHGTEMAGLALAGDLRQALAGTEPLDIQHRLEAVKLLPTDGVTGPKPYHHGYLTQEATARAEITAPFRRRVMGMAVTARDNRDRGAPSAWSAALDSLTADALEQGANPRLIVVSAGNTSFSGWSHYPISNDTDGIHDPAQAWNVVTVGAYTNLTDITEEDTDDYETIAPLGGLSPFSTTSLTWPHHSPLKPDIVLEGGNAAKDLLSPVEMHSLKLLTTNHRPVERLFTTTGATSAATALAARLAAQIMAEYPEYWPESVRGLMVHSAEWTDAMKSSYLPTAPAKSDYQDLLRRCGFGVPDLSRALWTASNSLTMVVQESLVPFKKEAGKNPVNRDMHIHQLPWPREALEDLGETQVEMRVTLSYYIEPNPSRRGRSRYRYESHGLRFDVKRPLESLDNFRYRINAAARRENQTKPKGADDPSWLIGKQGRHRGSLHGDIWRGSAAELASRGYVGVYPAVGWWSTRHALERYNQAARYSLIVSIRAPEIDVDLYTEVESQIEIPIVTEV